MNTTLSKVVNASKLEQKVKNMYRDVALNPNGEYHFEMGRVMAEKLGYGKSGTITGIDMTDEQLEKATRLAKEKGFQNIYFVKGYLENLPFENATFDVVISNGVINLCPDKEKVFSEVGRVLKPKGRMAIADTVLKAFESFRRIRDLKKTKQWLFRILLNKFISSYKKRKQFTPDEFQTAIILCDKEEEEKQSLINQ